MKTPLIAFALALSLTAAPVVAQGFDMGSLTPTLDFPKPTTEPVSQDRSTLNK
ncbi:MULTISPECIES: hypothetical protein [unclassified Roseovarius]|uniref:hypothetical protein n=1 Tax=unclassified Roseovarius TaxID=2614913 RepID=UPI00273DE9AE|nr:MULTISPECIES: hypothetical protein [unclassified Roseovarius]